MLYLQIDLLQADISQLGSQAISLWADVVVMNPPFGTRRKGADLEFLRAAFQVEQRRRSTIYLLCAGCIVQSVQLPNNPCQCLYNVFVKGIWKSEMGMGGVHHIHPGVSKLLKQSDIQHDR